MTKIYIPYLLAAIDLIQAIVCISHKDYPRFVYWISAGLLTVSTIYFKG